MKGINGPIRRLAPEKVYDVARMDLSSPTAESTKLAQGTLGIATIAAVGLYLYKKKRPTNKNTKHSVPEAIDVD